MNNNFFIYYNDTLLKEDAPIITANNRGLRYGDGFFETMKIINGKIILKEIHFERLFTSLELLQFQQPAYFNASFLEEKILALAKKNHQQKGARVRLNIFRANGDLYNAENHLPNYIMQTSLLNTQHHTLNKKGLKVDIFKDAKKVFDKFSHIKSNNYLPYTMAALWAKQNNVDDALLLNADNHIADATIANVWIVLNGIIKTPPLTEGCINGVMRKYLLTCLQKEGIPFQEVSITLDDIAQAQEIFLTNAITGIKWIKQCGKNAYHTQVAPYLFEKFVEPLWK
ncbi:MAG: aminotransferase class IV [Chitinophagaceae bacterium]|nr:aminotransferase class IV [Chitinophagaceae bacterium]MCW5904939.1 aminotransferase class IV [Chitinophagaceae bacterium]